MTNLKATKKALVSSVLALVMCFTMLLGTTFAWFTDSVTSAGNKIEAGKLDVELILHTPEGNYNISEDNRPIFGTGSIAQNDASETLWEPGKTQTVYLSIKNNGTLDLKYSVALEVTDIVNDLNEVMSYIITPDAKLEAPIAKDSLNWADGTSVVEGVNVAGGDVALKAGAEHFFALSVHMDELADNHYQEGSITFDLKVLAGQLASESDSFDNQYDALATYGAGYFVVPEDDQGNPVSAFDVEYYEGDDKVASMTVLTDALNSLGGTFKATPTDKGNVAISAGQSYKAYEVSLGGLKADNELEMVLQLRAEKGLDESTMTVYHEGQLVDDANWEYDAESGLVKITVTSFSPFVIVWGGDTAIEPDDEQLPVANVVREPSYENVVLDWESYGQWSPDFTVDAEPKLEAVYVFTAPHTKDNVDNSIYADWECDFFVKLDRDLAANQIFLGGNYGDFGWVGFHNGDVTLDANTEIPLLGSVASNAWTYADVVKFVETFICGVGDVDDALAGATFTVTLRLTNPDNSNITHDAAVITYTFPAAE